MVETVSLAKWSVWLNSHLNVRYGACFEEGVP